jgi:hypothetical protein
MPASGTLRTKGAMGMSYGWRAFWVIIAIWGGVAAFGLLRGGDTSSGPSPNAGFCSTHSCIPSFYSGGGTIVQCADGEWSHSGGLSGACADHGGEG